MKNKILLSLLALTDYKLLEPLPLGEGGKIVTSVSTGDYIGSLFRLALAIAGALAVFRLIYAGILYMSSDAFQKKNEAKGVIENALWGLGLAMGAWLIVALILPPQEKGAFVFPLSFKQTELPVFDNAPTDDGGEVGGSCTSCVPITVAHKEAPVGCKAPGPCQISSGVNAKLVALNKLDPGAFLVSESYPPTVKHKDPCHAAGTCVDATINSNAAQAIIKFYNNAKKSGLSATYEVPNKARFDELSKAGVTQLLVNTELVGNEHFHIK